MLQDIPFEIPPGQPPLVIVEAHAGDKPLAMLLDTGNAAAFDLLLSDAAAARLKGEPPPPPPSPLTAPQPGGPPPAVTIGQQRIERFRLGPVRLRNANAGVSWAFGTATTVLGRQVDGILGYRFLKGRTFSIDYRAKRVDLDARVPKGTPIAFDVGDAHPLTLVKVMIDGKGPFAFALDTGASASLVSPATAKAVGFGEGERVMIAGVGSDKGRGARLVRATLTLDGYTRANRNVVISSATSAIGAAAGVKLDGVLGADFFAGTRTTFDYKKNRLWIDQPASDAAAPAGVERENE